MREAIVIDKADFQGQESGRNSVNEEQKATGSKG